MTYREKVLTEKGYRYHTGCNNNEEAKREAAYIRGFGCKATVLTESRNGIYYYSVWYKR